MIRNWQLIIVPKLHVNGMALFPFILAQNRSLTIDKRFLNHERIHLRQQLEMLIIPFYILYGINYLYNRSRYKDHDTAYRNIVFEREAYRNEQNLQYLKSRNLYSWTRYIRM